MLSDATIRVWEVCRRVRESLIVSRYIYDASVNARPYVHINDIRMIVHKEMLDNAKGVDDDYAEA